MGRSPQVSISAVLGATGIISQFLTECSLGQIGIDRIL